MKIGLAAELWELSTIELYLPVVLLRVTSTLETRGGTPTGLNV
jgi:hypothetical protein